MASSYTPPPPPPLLSSTLPTTDSYSNPVKRINSHSDLSHFPSSPAYALLTLFILHLNASVSPLDPVTHMLRPPGDFTTDTTSFTISPAVGSVIQLVSDLQSLIAHAPPESGPRRFGNPAVRKWHQLVWEHLSSKFDSFLPAQVQPAKEELLYYLKQSFGSPERLDYGTGHELSFAAFLCGIWKLGGFHSGDERALVFRAFDSYFKLCRELVTTYSLEPAGSHGVWGLDDHSFLPYIFGSAQLTTYHPNSPPPATIKDLPKAEDVTQQNLVDRYRASNLYFSAIGFIHDVKRGPFWEHSPMLYDISGVQKGWGKINEGMLKMYEKEVLGKFPVVQHFWFGRIFKWREGAEDTIPESISEADEPPDDEEPPTILTKAPWAAPQPPPHPASAGFPERAPPPQQLDGRDSVAPWATPQTRAPWATSSASPPHQPPTRISQPMAPPLRDPMAPPSAADSSVPIGTRAPWASNTPMPPQRSTSRPPPSPTTASPPLRDPLSPMDNAAEPIPQPLKTSASLGPRRTNSPDSAVGNEGVGGVETGGVRVAESGDLGELLERRRNGTGQGCLIGE